MLVFLALVLIILASAFFLVYQQTSPYEAPGYNETPSYNKTAYEAAVLSAKLDEFDELLEKPYSELKGYAGQNRTFTALLGSYEETWSERGDGGYFGFGLYAKIVLRGNKNSFIYHIDKGGWCSMAYECKNLLNLSIRHGGGYGEPEYRLHYYGNYTGPLAVEFEFYNMSGYHWEEGHCLNALESFSLEPTCELSEDICLEQRLLFDDYIKNCENYDGELTAVANLTEYINYPLECKFTFRGVNMSWVSPWLSQDLEDCQIINESYVGRPFNITFRLHPKQIFLTNSIKSVLPAD